MTALVAFLAIACVALCAVVGIAFMDSRRHRPLDALLTARAKDLDAYRTQTAEVIASMANNLTALAARDTAQLQLVLQALISDRERLVTALLAQTNVPAARTVGLVDQVREKASRADTVREFIEDTMRSRAVAVDTEFETSDGQPIVPVGL